MIASLMLADSLMPSGRQIALFAMIAMALFAVYYLNRGRRDPLRSWPFLRKEERHGPPAVPATNREMREMTQNLERLATDLNERLDEKLAQMQAALDEADKLIAALRTMIDAARAAGVSLESILPGAAPSSNARPAQAAGVSLPDQPPRERASQLAAGDEAILKLADEGLSAIQIANRLGRYVGEVELVLNLHAAGRA